MSIPQTFIQELLTRADVVEIVGRYVQLKKGGANFMGLCPFHGEKSPSFSVSPAKQFYHCFGCGKKWQRHQLFDGPRGHDICRGG
jgi:DNA primase